MRINNTSIKAIIFTILLFSFIFFISLFKGVHLYNIKFRNFYIKHLFIKIDNKIVLKIDNIKVNSNSSNINFKKIIKYKKLLNYFQELKISNNKFSFYFYNDNFKLKLDNLSFSGVIKQDFINLEYINISNFKLKNILINLKNNYIYGYGVYNNQKITFKGKINKKNIILDVSTHLLTYKNSIIKNAKLTITLNSNFKYIIKGEIKNANINYNKALLNFKNISIRYDKKKFYLFIKNISTPKYQKIKNIQANNIHFFYDIKHNFIYSKIKKIKLNYLNYNFSFFDNSLILKNKNNFNFNSTTINIIFKDKKAILKNGVFIKFNKFTAFVIDNTKIVSKDIKLVSSKIVGDLIKIYIPIIKGKIFSFDTSIKEINASIKNRSLKAKEIIFNNIKANNILFKNNTLFLTSNALFNQNIKEVIKKFLKIDIPLTQLGGENKIFSKIVFDKNISTFTNIKTNTSIFKLFNFNLFIKKGETNITNENLIFNSIATLYLDKNLPIDYKGDGEVNFKKYNLTMNGIFNLNIKEIINLKNFKDKLYIDFKKRTLKTKNSNIFIDFNNKKLIINSLKNIISFTTLKDFIKEGLVLISFKDKIDIMNYVLLKKPLFYKHSNLPLLNKNTLINKMFFFFKIENNITNIYNQYTNITITTSSINATINSIDINLYPLENLFLNTNLNNEKNLTINLKTKNSNLIYKTHKFLSKKASFSYANHNLEFNSIYKNSSLRGYTKNNYLLIEGKNFSLEEFRAFLPTFNFFNDIKLDFVMVKSPDEFFNGKIYINYGVIKELKLLNNIIAFINTIPSLITFSSLGFSSKGYKIRNGYIDYLFYKNILYIKQAKIKGDNLDFYAKGYIDFNKNYIFLKVKANMKMKLKKIPIIGKGVSYLLFGKDGNIDIKMIVKGDLNNPKVKKDLGKEILQTPFNIFKRAITLPFHIY